MPVASKLAMTTKRAQVGFLLFAGALALQCFAACSEDHTEALAGAGGMAGSGGSGGTGPSTTGRGTGGVTTTAADANTTGGSSAEGLFACELPMSCDPVCTHLGWLGDCGGDEACVEGVWSSGETGVILIEGRSGPGGSQLDTLVVLMGDGQALRQARSRSCAEGEWDCDLNAIPWSVEGQERCKMGDPGSLQDCVSAHYSCDEVKAMLESAAGAGGAAGSSGEAGAGAEAGRAGETAE